MSTNKQSTCCATLLAQLPPQTGFLSSLLTAIVVEEALTRVCLRTRVGKFNLVALKTTLKLFGYDVRTWQFDHARKIRKSNGRDMLLFWTMPTAEWATIKITPGTFFYLTSIQEANRNIEPETGRERMIGIDWDQA